MRWLKCFIVAALVSHTAPAIGQDQVDLAQLNRARGRAIGFLKTKGQAENGSFSAANGPGVTSLCVCALMENGVSTSDPAVARALKYLEQFIQPDGGIHMKGTLYRNYETSLAILAFSKANKDGRYDKVLKKAERFIKGIQWTGESSDPAFGGGGYGKHKRPDLSNTSFLVEALKATGNDKNSEAMKRALLFISRCQNLESEHNTTPFGAKDPDGGFYYTPAAGGQSQAGLTERGGLRSYGSMTYQGLKSMIFAGVGPQDKRVQAAVKWIQKNYDLKRNPGMGDAGLFYYYHTFAKALDALGPSLIKDADGKTHNWRVELLDELTRRQRDDGSFVNRNARWLESDPNLVSAYALLALSYCQERPKKAK